MPRPCLLTEESGHVAAGLPGTHPEAVHGTSGPVKTGDKTPTSYSYKTAEIEICVT